MYFKVLISYNPYVVVIKIKRIIKKMPSELMLKLEVAERGL